MSMKISVDNLTCQRGGIAVLSGVSFEIAPGEAVILRGPNGAGKTTLLRCLAGLAPPMGGAVTIGSDDVAYSAHTDGLKAQLTAGENIAFWADVFGAKDISAAVEGFGLTALLDRRVQELSAGQKRRVALARLMLSQRRLWALDEPTVSLDSHAVAQFARAVGQHLQRGGSALIATHIDLGLPGARVLDVTMFRTGPSESGALHEDPFMAADFADDGPL